MPALEQHISQYQKNKQLLEQSCFDIENTDYPEWVVTILFYTAVHLIEAELAKYSQHCLNHKTRNKAVIAVENCKPIFPEYETLYRQSKKARYDCTIFTPKKIKQIWSLFERIESHLKVS
ncbi:hypothetical protein [Desulforamulus ferrireducens]|uniref:HEPN domain-containing protein n=1 Tax=Desulforamulus ferrireducens TaxID=1833852 RepID=A0A1S6IT96_9FIRM|nr:hypothetical protein [Desulforamulus ferrireducens]AQS58001.1 hypothetical protein B0537_02135 [Desulforamulus ferrireducens]